jgi:hypothetical protein
MISKNKECPVCGTFVSQVFLTCARAVHTHAQTHTHTHTHTRMDGSALDILASSFCLIASHAFLGVNTTLPRTTTGACTRSGKFSLVSPMTCFISVSRMPRTTTGACPTEALVYDLRSDVSLKLRFRPEVNA